MKRFFLILMTISLIACSSDDDNKAQIIEEEEQEQEQNDEENEAKRHVYVTVACDSDSDGTLHSIAEATYEDIMSLIYQNPDDCLYIDDFTDVEGDEIKGYVMSLG